MTKGILVHEGRNTHFSYTIPEGEGPFPVVLFSHGYNGCMTDFDQIREKLKKQNIASCALTFSGGSTRDESGYPSTCMTLETEKNDLLSLIGWAIKRDEIDKERMFLFGASMGGLVSCLAAKEAAEKIRAIILLFPALCIVDDWNNRFRDESEIPEEMMFWNLLLGKKFFTSMREMNVYEILSELTIKTLIFHGDKDPIVPVGYSEKAAKTMKNAALSVFGGEGHGFTSEANEKMDEMTIAFVKENL